MNKVIVEGIKVYAYHGCMEEEGRLGGNYIVDVTIETDFTEAAKTDDLSKTVDYVAVCDIVKSEMAVRSKLIEQVGQRIIDKIKHELKGIKKATVKVTKLNPPINGVVGSVCIEIEE
jgi:dihydroneopterin aldolase